MRYLFDTNAVLMYLKDREITHVINTELNPLYSENLPFISVVTLGEIEAIITRNKWGKQKIDRINSFINNFVVADINAENVIKMFGEIDAFSQGKHPTISLNDSARNMGKNDLWIAATASVTDSTLITSDRDFLHLKGTFLNLAFIDIQTKSLS
ncbi:MAG: type II toxin-antitoxin system VapC family toxin [Bacteroidia bacterium]